MNTGYELFRLKGVAVRVHASLVLLFAILVLLAFSAGGEPATVGLRLLAPFILFLTVLAHELGHAFTARALGIVVQDILLTPLGGAARLHGRIERPTIEALVAVAGPGVNLALAVAMGGILLATGRVGLGDLSPLGFFAANGEGLAAQDPWSTAVQFNTLLGVLNLVPAFPMDGGRVFRALLWMRTGRLIATRIACRVGMWFSTALILAPLFLGGIQWWLLPLVGLTLFFAAWRERLVVETEEGMLRLGLSLRGGPFATAFGMPPDGAGAPGGDAGPARGDFSDDGVIDVPGSSRIVDEDSNS